MSRSLLTTLCALAFFAGATFAQEPRLSAAARVVPEAAAAGEEVVLEVTLNVDPGWHIYGARETTSIPTSLSIEDAAPLEVVGPAQVPPGERHEAFGIESYWLAGDVILRQKLRVPEETAGGVVPIRARVDYMPCTDELCDPPNAVTVTAELRVKADEPAPPAEFENHVAVSARFVPAAAGPGDEVALEVTLDVEEGWHVYGSSETTSIPTTLTVEKAGPLEAIGAPRIPPGERQEAFGIESFYLEGRQVLRQRMKVPADAESGEVTATGRIDFMACDDQTCDPPAAAAWSAALTIARQEPGAQQAPPTLQDPFALLGDDKVRFGEARVTPATARPGELVVVEVPVSPAEGWHVYGAKDENPVRLRAVDVGPLIVHGENRLPDGERHEVTEDFVNYWLSEDFVLAQAFLVPADAETGDRTLRLAVDYQVCDENNCVPRDPHPVTAGLTIEAGPAREAFLPQTGPAGPAEGAAEKGADPFGGLWQLILLSIGAGLFALAMPCTYPMIPITISFFTKQASSRGGSVLPLSLAYGAGIVLVFIAIGVLVGPAIVPFARHWVVNLVIAALFLAFGLSLFGLFTIQPPRFLMDAAARASTTSGYGGVFLMGTTLVVTSFTCTAPFIGTLLGSAASAGLGAIVVGMTVFGLTMAIPFIVLSLLPGRLQAIPRAGEWMNTLKVFLGFVEVAASLKFFSNAEIVWRIGALPRELFLLLWAAIFFVAGLFLLGMFKLKDMETSIGAGRMTGGLASMMFAAYCSFGALGFRMDNIMTAIVPNYSSGVVGAVAAANGNGEAGPAEALSAHTIVKDDYQAALALAREQDKLVLVNFTGYT